MALYEVTGPDGETYEVEAPEGTTKAQIIAAVESSLNKERRTEAQQDYFDYLAQIYAREKEEEIEADFIDQGQELIKGSGWRCSRTSRNCCAWRYNSFT